MAKYTECKVYNKFKVGVLNLYKQGLHRRIVRFIQDSNIIIVQWYIIANAAIYRAARTDGIETSRRLPNDSLRLQGDALRWREFASFALPQVSTFQ